jgi:cyclase
MLQPRIIPCLLVKNNGLVKTVKFDSPKYLGDPINAVRIFNEKQVDELIVIDIDASIEKRSPNFKLIENLAIQCRMPLCYGGGIHNVEDASEIFSLGVEKVALSSGAIQKPSLVKEIASLVGNQSVVIVIDVKLDSKGEYTIWTHNGKVNTGLDPVLFAKQMEDFGAGEIIVNSIDNDGLMKGYDLNIVTKVHEVISIPMSVLGGAGSLDDIGKLFNRFGIIGAAAGSLFVFKGVYKAVLINYPETLLKKELMTKFIK